ncbi:putative transcriptional regulator [Bradyrhizobium sp. AZCC 2289]
MDHPLRRPEEILAYRPLKQILKSGTLWTIGPTDTVLAAVRIMEEKNIGFLVVLENEAIAGVVSERDCLRRMVLAGKLPEATAVGDIMVKNVVKVGIEDTFAECLRLMHAHGISSPAGSQEWQGGRRRLDPRPAARGGRTSRQDHRRA